MTISDAIREILEDQPTLTAGEMHSALAERGITAKETTVSSTLTRIRGPVDSHRAVAQYAHQLWVASGCNLDACVTALRMVEAMNSENVGV
jgi:hypothetical protein